MKGDTPIGNVPIVAKLYRRQFLSMQSMRNINVLAFLSLLATPLKAQSLGSKLLGHYDEQVIGGVGNLALRGPWIAKGWRKPLPRAILWHAISYGYERIGDSSHDGKWDVQAKRDFMGREIGYLLTEGVIALYLTIRHK